jgi:hypothetical protein
MNLVSGPASEPTTLNCKDRASQKVAEEVDAVTLMCMANASDVSNIVAGQSASGVR